MNIPFNLFGFNEDNHTTISQNETTSWFIDSENRNFIMLIRPFLKKNISYIGFILLCEVCHTDVARRLFENGYQKNLDDELIEKVSGDGMEEGSKGLMKIGNAECPYIIMIFA